MGNNVGVYKTGYNTCCSSRPQNQPRSVLRLFRLIPFSFFFLVHDGVQDKVSVVSRVNSHQLMAPF